LGPPKKNIYFPKVVDDEKLMVLNDFIFLISLITDLDPDSNPDPQNENQENRYSSKTEGPTDDSKTDLNLLKLGLQLLHRVFSQEMSSFVTKLI
jgi:hypothetical protein